ncbi:MAG: hypothetical protein EOP04_10890 [Proteobacteria bacterium]|nr:MAG: hypothetical protein EOP04_10890 [Pseudomonadota bacterium]
MERVREVELCKRIVERLDRQCEPVLFANVTEAEQKNKIDNDIIKFLGKDKDHPKSGDYWAAFVDGGIGSVIIEMINNEEYV